MPTRLTHQLRAFIASQLQKLNAYLENERTREISQAENNETALAITVAVIIFLLAGRPR